MCLMSVLVGALQSTVLCTEEILRTFFTRMKRGGQENESHRRSTSASMKEAQNDNHRVKIMRMGTQLFIIYDPSKAASQSNHHMQRVLSTHVSACSPALVGGRKETFPAAEYRIPSAMLSAGL